MSGDAALAFLAVGLISPVLVNYPACLQATKETELI